MKLLVQWATRTASDWIEVDSSDGAILAKKATPTNTDKVDYLNRRRELAGRHDQISEDWNCRPSCGREHLLPVFSKQRERILQGRTCGDDRCGKSGSPPPPDPEPPNPPALEITSPVDGVIVALKASFTMKLTGKGK